MNKRDLFYILAKKHFDVGVMREIYSNDSISICNLAESMYLAIPYDEINNNVPIGVVVDVNMIKKIIDNHNYVYHIVNSYVSQNQRKYILPINDKLINVFLPIKEIMQKGEEENPGIDLNFEEELMKKNRTR